MPNPTSKIKVLKENQATPAQGTFTIKPLEPGYATTIGNALRRVLLQASLEGHAITHVKFDTTVLHEFDTIKGVLQGVSQIILNLKQVRLKQINEYQGEKITIHITGKESFKAGDITQFTSAFEVLNPDLTICTMDPSVDLNLNIVITKGKGYLPAENNNTEHKNLGYIPIDAVFTPIRNVKWEKTTTLVGERTDYEKLTLDIETDGSITAEEALQKAAHNLTKHFSLLYDDKAIVDQPDEEEIPTNKEFLRMRQLLNSPLNSLNLKVKIYNTLDNKGYKTLGDLAALNANTLMMYKGFGKKVIQDIKDELASQGLTLGMDVQKYKVKPLTNV